VWNDTISQTVTLFSNTLKNQNNVLINFFSESNPNGFEELKEAQQVGDVITYGAG